MVDTIYGSKERTKLLLFYEKALSNRTNLLSNRTNLHFFVTDSHFSIYKKTCHACDRDEREGN